MTGLAEISNVLGQFTFVLVAIMIVVDIQSDVRRLVTGRNIVLASIIIWYLLEAVSVSPGIMVNFTQEDYDFSIFCILLASCMFLIGYSARSFHIFDNYGKQLRSLDRLKWQWRLFLIGFAIGSIPILILGKFDLTLYLDGVFEFQKRFSSPLARGRYGGIRDAMIELQLFFKVSVIVGAVIILRRDASMGKKTACGIFLLWMLLKAMNSGSRSEFFVIAFPVAAGIYYLMNEHRKKIALLVGGPLVILAGYYWSAAVVVTRGSGDFDFAAAQEADYVGFEMFQELMYITDQIGGTLDYQFGQTYFTQIVNPIPRFLWPGKPVSDAGLMLAIARGEVSEETGEAYLTRSPGLIGEMYWNFGLLGILALSTFGGVVVKSWDVMREVHRDSLVVFMVYIAGLAILFLSGRSFNMPMFYGLLALYLLMVLLNIRASRRRVSAVEKGSLEHGATHPGKATTLSRSVSE